MVAVVVAEVEVEAREGAREGAVSKEEKESRIAELRAELKYEQSALEIYKQEVEDCEQRCAEIYRQIAEAQRAIDEGCDG